MTKKETLKWTLQILASIISAVLTALGATSCMGFQGLEQKESPAQNEREILLFKNNLLTIKACHIEIRD